ncbi:4-oxalocrotonate tautomerase [Granulicatella balaenopterae]|uniref:Tautomerase n=1 Tax=Granulicatella balaenopterae TaxID=137733 RepID=A0A1H9I3A4_9LACT|nr:2-hydroxymuconate tautomerase [Granulicatella balaenopterae]SEQ69069.1 4-oxalocrotonate tautomerase [Granulicatella balaenopterae]
MPFVHVEMLEGRTREQKENLVKDITEVVAKNTGAPTDAVHVIITDLKPENLGQKGKLRG